MGKKILLSVIATSALIAQEITLEPIDVIEKATTKVVENINTQEVKNADLAEALAKESPSISLIRRSGIANDIILRGQKRDNIRVTIDDAVICGACPNRMDPPTSHVITTMVDNVQIKEGPFDVTEMGNLSGGVKIQTAQPTKELSGEIGTTFGSYGYKKGFASISGGNDIIQASLTYSNEESEQYEDGDGNTLAQQLDNYGGWPAPAGNRLYTAKYDDMKAYEKESVMAKIHVNLTDNQELDFSATRNRSDDILYPSTGMDAIYDDSNLYNLKYTAKNLASFSKKLQIQAYKTDVDHPMSIEYRNNNAAKPGFTNHLTTDVKGLKIQNEFEALGRTFNIGIDTSKRNWDGKYYTDASSFLYKSIDDTDTKNKAIFIECTNNISQNLTLKTGLRYDSTDIETADSRDQDNDYNSTSGFIQGTYKLNNTTFFAGIGQSFRVPDARELYFVGSMMATHSAGTDDLEQTRNREIDLGIEQSYDQGFVKLKTFYSDLKNYIYFNSDTPTLNAFENIDAKIYGLELTGAYYINDQFTLDMGYTYKRGKKDSALDGQNDKDLADITPPKFTLGLTYDHDENTYVSAQVERVGSWNHYDEDNGEQYIDSYAVLNLKGQTTIAKNFELTLGVDNVFDRTYAVSNTYKDLTLISGAPDVMLLNEPGRYFYTSLKYKF